MADVIVQQECETKLRLAQPREFHLMKGANRMPKSTVDTAQPASRFLENLLEKASSVHESGNLLEAKGLYEAILKLQPLRSRRLVD